MAEGSSIFFFKNNNLFSQFIHSDCLSHCSQFTKARSEETDFSDTQSCEDQHPLHYDDTCSPQENTIDSTEQGKTEKSQQEGLYHFIRDCAIKNI